MQRWKPGIAIVGIGAAMTCVSWTAAAPPTPILSDLELREALLSEFEFVTVDGVAPAEPSDDLLALASEPDDPNDPAYDEYREARRVLNRARYRRASEMLTEIQERYPRSVYADDSLYWAAFARYRLAERVEDRQDFLLALELLEALKNNYTSSGVLGDADDLKARIQARLAELGDAESAERTRERASGNDDDELRLIALDALLQMNSDDALPILERVLLENHATGNAEMRARAVFILSQNDSPETTNILLDVARNDPDHEVRMQAVFWLSQVDDDRAVDALVEILASADDEELQEKAIFALSQHDSEQAARALREFATDASKADELRENAIFWLGQQSSNNFEFLTELYGDLESLELREKVLFAVSQQSSRRNRDWLMQRLLDADEDTELRKQALFWVGQMDHIECAELGQLVGEFDDEEILEQLVFVLGQRREDECVEALINIARSTEDVELRKRAVFWLGQTRHPSALRFLEELIGQ